MARSRIDEIGTALQGIVAGSTGWENVYLGDRLDLDWGAYISRFKDSAGVVAGATVSWGPYSEDPLDTMENLLGHTMVIRCMMAAGEDTERDFRAKIEDVMEELRDHPVSASGLWELMHSMSFTEFQHRVFGTVLCHFTEIRVIIDERVARDD